MPQDSFGTFFGPEDDNRVPGEILVKLTSDNSSNITESIPSGPLRRLASAPTRFGNTALDKAFTEFKVASVIRVHSPISSQTVADLGVGQQAADLSATYRVRFTSSRVDLKKASEQIGNVKGVAEVSPNYYRYCTVVPNDPMYSTQWGLTRIHGPDAWDRTTGDPAIVVAVVDTGVDLDHPDLAAQLVAGQDLVDMVGVAPRPGWRWDGDFLTRDNDPQDEVGHGTHVAGTIAAISNNAVGVAGVAWRCRIMPVKVLARLVNNTTGAVSGSGTAVDIAAGIRWAVDHGARIISMSLGGYSDTFVERDAVAYAVGRGVLVVAAMGNDDTNMPSFPGAYPDVVAVGATNQTDNRVSRANTGGAWGSNTGNHIDVVAPGVNIRSTDWDNTYSYKSGTSMATPHVSGVAALVMSCNRSLTAAQVAQIIRDTAQPLRDVPADPIPNDRYGFGLVNARAALDRACPPIVTSPIFDVRPTLITVDIRPTLPWLDIQPTNPIADVRPTLITLDIQPTNPIADVRPTIPTIDIRPTLRIFDQPGTITIFDQPNTSPIFDQPGGTSPALDRPGTPSGADIPGGQPPGRQPDPAPFVLATPHHTTAWAAYDPQEFQAVTAQYEDAIGQYQKALMELQTRAESGQVTQEEAIQYEQIYAEYQALMQEYQQLMS